MNRILFTDAKDTATRIRKTVPTAKSVTSSVKRIIEDVRRRGDEAIHFWCQKLDKLELRNFTVSDEEITHARKTVKSDVLKTLKECADSVRKCAKEIVRNIKTVSFSFNHLDVSVEFAPVESVLCYAPGGFFSLSSSLLMASITADVAGVKNIYATSPNPSEHLLTAVSISPIKRLYRLGGPQALAAFAFSTESIPKVDMIVGPGGVYVTEAKRILFGTVGIDILAGPSELLIIADKGANTKTVALDLLAQAEHSPDALSVLASPETELLDSVEKEMDSALESKEVPVWLKKKANKIVAVCAGLRESVGLANSLAPEHIQLMVKEPDRLARKLNNYGALFCGYENGAVFGDYCSATNHILPTASAARFSSALSPLTFLRLRYKTTQKEDKMPPKFARCAAKFAELEGLYFHSKSAYLRLKT